MPTRDQRQRTRAGRNASGVTALVAGIERYTFDELEPELVHSVDLAGQVTDLRTYTNGSVGVTMVVAPEYAHEAMKLVQDSRLMFTFLRCFNVPRPAMLLDDDDDDGDT